MNALMRLLAPLSIVLVLGLPASAVAHPGNTDSQGGHTCRTNCASWGLGNGQYHLHNRPARAPREPAPSPQPPIAPPHSSPAPIPPPVIQPPRTETHRPATQDENLQWTLTDIFAAIIFIPLSLVIPFAWGLLIYGAVTGKIKNWQ
jgi:hypothetical protein